LYSQGGRFVGFRGNEGLQKSIERGQEVKRKLDELMGWEEFWLQLKKYGWHLASANWLICFTKWYAGAKRIRLEYPQERMITANLIRSKESTRSRKK
jgi:hypothetical protein